MCSSMLSAKVLCIFKATQCTQRAKRSENASSGRLQEVKKLENHRPKRWSRSLTFWCFGLTVVMGGGRLREVVGQGGSTVCGELRQDL